MVSSSIFVSVEAYAYLVLRPEEDKREYCLLGGIDEDLLKNDFQNFIAERGQYPDTLVDLMHCVGFKRYIWKSGDANSGLTEASPLCDYYGCGIKPPQSGKFASATVLLIYREPCHGAKLVFFADHKLRWVPIREISQVLSQSDLIRSTLRQTATRMPPRAAGWRP
jgi:hypothetical protein